MSDKKICLGKIVGVHGIRGEVKVKSYTALDKDLGSYGDLEDKNSTQKFALEHSQNILEIICFFIAF